MLTMKVLDKETKKQRLLIKIEKLESKHSIKQKEYELLGNTINDINSNIDILKKQVDELDKAEEPKVATVAERKKTEPHIYCKICRRTFFGITIEDYKKALQSSNPFVAFDTDYHRHRENCKDTCELCGLQFSNHMSKKNHKCIKVMEIKHSYLASNNKKKEPVEYYTTSKTDDEWKIQPKNVKSTIEEINSDSEEDDVKPWYDSTTKKKYYVNNNNDVFDEYDEQIGYRWQDRLIHTDDECYEDFVDNQE